MISVAPTDRTVEVGAFSLDPEDDTIFIEVQQMSPNQTWNYSFGLLWWESAFGRELGTQKVYGHSSGEIYKLGINRAPRSSEGKLFFTTRAYNRGWISISDPPIWTLSISAESAKSGSGSLSDIPSFGVRSTLGSLVDANGSDILFKITDDIATIQ